MKKRNVINLIKYYSEGNDRAFRDEAYTIANEFDALGDEQIAEYIVALLSEANAFVPQSFSEDASWCVRMSSDRRPLTLPGAISSDLEGIMNAIKRNAGVNKFLFYGAPGTGKTESVKYIAYLLGRDLLTVNFDEIIDSKLGQTSKNISSLFKEIASYRQPEKLIFLFDEIDALVLDRVNSSDLREMGRATSSFLKEMDKLPDKAIIIATTNLFSKFDKALIRRFDACINFDRYTKDDKIKIAKSLMQHLSSTNDDIGQDVRLFNKILDRADKLPSPADLYNIIKTCIAFSSPESEFDYLARVYENLIGPVPNPEALKSQSFTVREIAHLTGASKSTVARGLKDQQA